MISTGTSLGTAEGDGWDIITYSEDVVRVCEEADSGNHTSSDMVPAKGSLVDLCEGESSPLVGVLDVDEVVVEVVVGSIATGRLVDRSRSWSWSRSHLDGYNCIPV